jgi:hypothetical protein
MNQKVEQIELDIDNWELAPTGDNIISQTETKEGGKTIFSKDETDISFLDKTEDVKETLEDLDSEIKPTEETIVSSKKESSELIDFLKKRIESKEMFAFDDFDETKQDLSDYLSTLSKKDIDELWKANIDNLKQEVASKTPQEFFESLPTELQYAAKYVMDGGTDLKGIFKALSAVEEVRALDVDKEDDRELIVRSYLQAIGETPEDIDSEIEDLKDTGKLEKKAKSYKPKLDKMQEEIVQHKIAEQEYNKQKQIQAAQQYTQKVYEALNPGVINGLKLDNKTQAFLYQGLTQANYSSINGKNTNLLGHLLEHHQFIAPNYPLIAEALWLLSNPEDYRKSLIVKGKNEAVENTVRQLKTEQSKKTASTLTNDNDDIRTKRIPKQTNIFKR